MDTVKIKFKESEYELGTSLRVAYNIQNAFGHKPYLKVFQEIDKMVLEEQIKILYIAFNTKNPNVCTEKEFLDEMLDNGSIISINTTIGKVIENISFNGLSDEEIEARKKAAQAQMMTNPQTTM